MMETFQHNDRNIYIEVLVLPSASAATDIHNNNINISIIKSEKNKVKNLMN